MPGDLNRFLGRTTMARCPDCGGVDLLSLGVIAHSPSCPRNPTRIQTCEICGFEILPGEKRAPSRTVPIHIDCLIDFEHHLDEEHQ